MKLRLKLGAQRKPLHIDDDSTLQDLRPAIGETFNLTGDDLSLFELSLNGTDTIHSHLDNTLSKLGIVDGDLVHVVLPATITQQVAVAAAGAENSQSNHEAQMSTKNEASVENSRTTVESLGAMSSDFLPPGPSIVPETEGSPDPMEYNDDEVQDKKVNQYLREPMLVSDSTSDCVPWALKHVYEESQVTNVNEALYVLLHVLMSESGFQSGIEPEGMHHTQVVFPLMPSGWKAQKILRLTYSHESCPQATFTLICVPMGQVVIIHGRASGVTLGQKCQIQLKPADVIGQLDAKACKTYKNLPKFSRAFKDNVAYPVIQLCRQSLGHPNTIGLIGLMEEVKMFIFSHLDAQSLCRMSQVTREFHRLGMQTKLWRRLYLRSFGRRTHNSMSQDWFKLYKEKHILRRDMRNHAYQSRCVIPPQFIPAPFLGPGDPFPFNPGFIGGDYDRYPAIPGLPGGFGPALPRPPFDPLNNFPQQFFPGPRGGSRGGRGRGGRFGVFFM